LARRKKRKAGRARCIRSYTRIANQHHGMCPFCHDDIEAGDEYEGNVYVNGAELWVVKQHMFCEPWDGFEEPEEEYWSLDEEVPEEEEQELAMAA